MSVETWLVFVGVWIVAGLPLGPNALNCISVSATSGFFRSLFAIVGILIAALMYMAATVFGLAAILLANAELFQILKFLGAAYLIWMGISLWRKQGSLTVFSRHDEVSGFRIVRQSILISLTNPKAVISYMAVFSQFIDHQVPLAGQMIVLVPTALIVTAMIYVMYCLIGVPLTRILSTARRFKIFNRAIGSFYICAGVGIALADIRPTSLQASSSR